jgi:hypothetical protein
VLIDLIEETEAGPQSVAYRIQGINKLQVQRPKLLLKAADGDRDDGKNLQQNPEIFADVLVVLENIILGSLLPTRFLLCWNHGCECVWHPTMTASMED